ncbi:hypothetical protein C173_20581 [Paenibacillus sp. FSL R7-277]|uniref:hypothetical protein n=1 Tax=unclassified Paenibacillus TaxID=185978 RepID=UPI0003E2245F|nr:hypothetical protein [Paenibacillus sp. FSL R7-277]ETT65460.1 hypothetical protein C173_20581 [Paenibacillus sp. FSL R7-277]
MMNLTKDLAKLIRLTGDRAKLDAKANGTYIVYKTNEGQIVREYSTGEIEKMNEQDFIHE